MNRYLKITWNALLTALVITLLSGLFILAMPPSYRATATVQAAADNLVLFQSATLLREVAETTDLETASLKTWSDLLLDREASTLNLLRQRISVSHDDAGNWTEVSVTAADPDIAATVANALVVAYLRRSSTVNQSDAARREQQQAIAATREEIIGLKSEHPDLRNPAPLDTSLDRRARELTDRLRALETELIAKQTQAAVLASGDAAPIASEPGFRRVLVKQEQLLNRKAELAARYGPGHQKMISLESELAETRAQVAALLDNAKNRARLACRTLEQRMNDIETQLADIDRERLEFERRKTRLNELQTHLERLQAGATVAADDIDEARYAAAIPPESSLGLGQVRIMLLVFVTSFVIVAVIGLARPAAR